MNKPLVLYHYWRSTSSWRVRWALKIKGLDVQYKAVNLLEGESETPEHLNRNPVGHVPVLQVGENYLIESVSIIEWLEELIPAPQLYPGDIYERAHIRALVEVINSETQPLQNLGVLEKYSDNAEVRKEWARHFIAKGLHAFEKLLKSPGPYSCGKSITAADVFLIPQLLNAQRFEFNLSEFPKLESIWNNALKTPACAASHPDKFKPT
jgi:maleylacetoacetate isomerase